MSVSEITKTENPFPSFEPCNLLLWFLDRVLTSHVFRWFYFACTLSSQSCVCSVASCVLLHEFCNQLLGSPMIHQCQELIMMDFSSHLCCFHKFIQNSSSSQVFTLTFLHFILTARPCFIYFYLLTCLVCVLYVHLRFIFILVYSALFCVCKAH